MVLNVDDNEMNQLVISKVLETAGLKIISVNNGAEAVKKLEEGLLPDFIILDLEMPVMNGLKTVEYLRKKMNNQIPVIINSGLVPTYDRYKLKSLGVNDFLEKPYSLNDIFTKLSKNITVAQE